MPFKTARPSYISQARVIFELKLPKVIKSPTSINAGIAELLCAFHRSRHPIVLITTDLQTLAHVFFVKESCLTQVLNVSPFSALEFAAAFLLTCNPSPSFRLDPAPASMAVAAGSGHFFEGLIQAMQNADISRSEDSLQAQLQDLHFLPEDERFYITHQVIRSWNDSHAAMY